VSISVTIVGGPEDGIEVAVDEGYNRVHMVTQSGPWLEVGVLDDEVTEVSCADIEQVVMPVRTTARGYRAYWSERLR
jgi:hypothetical protein